MPCLLPLVSTALRWNHLSNHQSRSLAALPSVVLREVDLEDSDDDISEIQQEIASLTRCDLESITCY